MGAILAVVGDAGDPELEPRLERMLARSPHRGQSERHVEAGFAIAIQSLGWNASLAVTDQRVVAFHGWIGNRRELSAQYGIAIESDCSNAAWLAELHSSLGDRVFEHLRGEFAILLLDRRERRIVALRDVVGTRPLHVLRHSNRLFLATEIRQVLAGSEHSPDLNEEAMAMALARRFVPYDKTLYTGVERLRPATVWSVELDHPTDSPSKIPYWQPPEENQTDPRSVEEHVEELRFVLERAVTRALPDRPFAVALSGGMDSSTIWAMIAKNTRAGDPRASLGHPISLSFPGMSCDESTAVEAIFEHTSTTGDIINATKVNVVEFCERYVDWIDELFVPTLYHLELVAEEATQQDRTVLLYGLGGDEWLGGGFAGLRDAFSHGNPLSGLSGVFQVLSNYGPSILPALYRALIPYGRDAETPLPSYIHHRWRDRLPAVPEALQAHTGRATQLTRLFIHHGATFFTAAEQLAARCGVEIRSPLTDIDLIELCFRLPSWRLVSGGMIKGLMRFAVSDSLPSEVVHASRKVHFSEVVDRELPQLAERTEPFDWRLVQGQIAVRCVVERMISDILSGQQPGESHHLLQLFIAERFCRRLET